MSNPNETPGLVVTASALRYVTPYQYAQLCGLTKQAIYNRINKGTQPVVLLDGPAGLPTAYIDVEAHPPCRKPRSGGRPRKA